MADQNRWGEGRYEDRYGRRDPRDEVRGGDYGRHPEQDRYRFGGEGERRQYREDPSFDRERSTGGGDYSTGGYPSRGGHGEEAYRDRKYGTTPPREDYRPPSDRAAADNMIHRPPYDRSGERPTDWYRSDYERGRGDYRGHDERSDRNQHDAGHGPERTPWDRTRDQVASWFGDHEAAQRHEQDRARGGPVDHHVGKGPKGYVRSDDRIREDVSDRLTQDWLIDASEIEVQVSGAEVTLSGLVADRSDKRRAEDIADHISGVKHVQNNLRIRQSVQAEAFGHSSTDDDAVQRTTDGDAARLKTTN